MATPPDEAVAADDFAPTTPPAPSTASPFATAAVLGTPTSGASSPFGSLPSEGNLSKQSSAVGGSDSAPALPPSYPKSNSRASSLAKEVSQQMATAKPARVPSVGDPLPMNDPPQLLQRQLSVKAKSPPAAAAAPPSAADAQEQQAAPLAASPKMLSSMMESFSSPPASPPVKQTSHRMQWAAAADSACPPAAVAPPEAAKAKEEVTLPQKLKTETEFTSGGGDRKMSTRRRDSYGSDLFDRSTAAPSTARASVVRRSFILPDGRMAPLWEQKVINIPHTMTTTTTAMMMTPQGTPDFASTRHFGPEVSYTPAGCSGHCPGLPIEQRARSYVSVTRRRPPLVHRPPPQLTVHHRMTEPLRMAQQPKMCQRGCPCGRFQEVRPSPRIFFERERVEPQAPSWRPVAIFYQSFE